MADYTITLVSIIFLSRRVQQRNIVHESIVQCSLHKLCLNLSCRVNACICILFLYMYTKSKSWHQIKTQNRVQRPQNCSETTKNKHKKQKLRIRCNLFLLKNSLSQRFIVGRKQKKIPQYYMTFIYHQIHHIMSLFKKSTLFKKTTSI